MTIKEAEALLRDVWNGSPWYGKSVSELLQGIDYHSDAISDIIHHMISWRVFALKNIQGEVYKIDMDSSVDWPKEGHIALEDAIELLEKNLEMIISELRNRDDLWLQNIVPGTSYSFEFLIEGIVQHDIYHVGQIALLKKLGM